MNDRKTKKLSHEVNVATLPARGLRLRLEPDAVQMQALVEEADVLSIKRFDCELLFKRWHKNGVSVTGEVYAELTQECVVTLEPIKTQIREEIDRTFVPDGSKLTKPRLNNEGEMVLDFDGRDEPEPFVGDTLDAWEIALEHFLLGIDPFPRKEGAEISSEDVASEEGQDGPDGPEPGRQNPFAGLKDLLNEKSSKK